ncbi:hypothetical protein BP5796_05936 [Coleophoma crateriformis]|uniref:Uncharacterized protein n=1 Tax=Coleophoma crateriformis TaxID=565419 RepID=A0A3D8RW69_9HELO|nr:hypothetical protein BP5796_05936 [Coleophoma crateriformis]
MATRRIISSEKTILEKDDKHDLSPAAGEKSNIAPAVPALVFLCQDIHSHCAFGDALAYIADFFDVLSLVRICEEFHLFSASPAITSHLTFSCFTCSLTRNPHRYTDRSPFPIHVIIKLLGFTFAMIVCPIGSYFLTLNMLFGGNSTYAGAFAAIMANVVLVAYVIVAMNEDDSEAIEAEAKKKKGL